VSLEDRDNVISEIEDLKIHITSFYKNLFGSEPGQWVSDEDNAFLIKPFSDEEIEFAIKDMKTNTAPGPDGFPVAFYKEFLGGG
jgi:hypothetical protein